MAPETERSRLLESMGFTVLGVVAEVDGVTPGWVWRSAINLAAEPDRRGDSESEDAVTRAEDVWRSYGRELGLFGSDGSFLISVSGPGAMELPWIHVRGADNVGFLLKLADQSGSVDFVAMSPTGPPVVAVTEEEWDFWITNVNLLAEI